MERLVPHFTQAPPGFVCTSTPEALRIAWRTRDAWGRWFFCASTLALGFVLPTLLLTSARDLQGALAAALLFAWAALAWALQLRPLRRLFFLELSSGHLLTDSTPARLPLSGVRSAIVLKRSVVRKVEDRTTTEMWHELWLQLEGDTRIQVGSRMDYADAVYLSEQLHLVAPRVACIADFTSEDLSEPGRWMSTVGGVLTFALVLGFIGFLGAATARHSPIANRARALAGADPAVTRLLGAPLRWGWRARVSEPKPNAARLFADVRGPNGAGTLQADGYFKNDEWCFAELRLSTSHGGVVVRQPVCVLTPFEREAVYYVPPVKSGGH